MSGVCVSVCVCACVCVCVCVCVQAEVSRLRAELRALRGTGLVSDDGLSSLREQLQAAVDRALHMEKELSKTRSQLQKYKNAERSVLDLTTGMSVEAKRRVDELQKRLNVLEKQVNGYAHTHTHTQTHTHRLKHTLEYAQKTSHQV